MLSSNNLMLSKSTPVPSTTQVRGLSAIRTGTFNSFFKSSLSHLSIEPHPVNIIPLSTISEDNSGGVCSQTLVAALTIL